MILLKNGKQIDEEGIIDALDDNDFEHYYFFDKQTGAVEIAMSSLISGMDEDEERIEMFDNDPGRYVPIPKLQSYEKYEWMVDFSQDYVLEKKKNNELFEKLSIALDGKGAFHRFKNVIYNAGDEWVKAWYSFEHTKMQKEVFDWLEAESIEYSNN